MKKRFLLSFMLAAVVSACAPPQPAGNANTPATTGGGDAAFKMLHDKYVVEFLRRNPQAITYRLGKEQIYALREKAARTLGASFSPKAFHVLFMKQGTIPAGYFREELLRQLEKAGSEQLRKTAVAAREAA